MFTLLAQSISLADSGKDFLPENVLEFHTVPSVLHRMDIRKKIQNLLDIGLTSTSEDKLVVGNIKDFTPEEIEIIFEYKVFVYNRIIYVTAPSKPHQYMIACILNALDKGIANTLNTARNATENPTTNYNPAIRLWGKYSCGIVKEKQADLAISVCEGDNFSTPVVGECAFANESLNELIIQAGEILAESTDVEYSISWKLNTTEPFQMDFYIFRRTIRPNPQLIDALQDARIGVRLRGCNLIHYQKMKPKKLSRMVGIEIVHHHVINQSNYEKGFSFDLDGQVLGLGNQPITFHVTGEDLARLRKIFLIHVGSPDAQQPRVPDQSRAYVENLLTDDEIYVLSEEYNDSADSDASFESNFSEDDSLSGDFSEDDE